MSQAELFNEDNFTLNPFLKENPPKLSSVFK